MRTSRSFSKGQSSRCSSLCCTHCVVFIPEITRYQAEYQSLERMWPAGENVAAGESAEGPTGENVPAYFRGSGGPDAYAVPGPNVYATSVPNVYATSGGPNAYAMPGPNAYAMPGPNVYATSGPNAYAMPGPNAYATSGPNAYAVSGPDPYGPRQPYATPGPVRRTGTKTLPGVGARDSWFDTTISV